MTQVLTAGWPDRLLNLADWESLPLDEAHHVECSEGVLVVTPKPLPRHQRAMVRLTHAVDRQLPAGLAALAEVEVILPGPPLTIRAPDVLVTSTAVVTANPARLQATDALLAVEISSEGSRRTDRVTKMSEYAEAGIPEYWIVDLDDPVSLACHRLDSRGGYQPHSAHEGAAGLPLRGVPVHIDLDNLVVS